MAFRNFAMLSAICFFSATAAAQTPPPMERLTKEELTTTGPAFARCAALYDVLKNYSAGRNDAQAVEIFQGIANGARISAEAITRLYGADANYQATVQAVYQESLPPLQAAIANGGPEDSGLEMPIKVCTGLNSLQGQLITEIQEVNANGDTSDNWYFFK